VVKGGFPEKTKPSENGSSKCVSLRSAAKLKGTMSAIQRRAMAGKIKIRSQRQQRSILWNSEEDANR
jgi:hypothetical protein